MTREEIIKMPAGEEMDVLIAEKIMGWEIRKRGRRVYKPDFGEIHGFQSTKECRNFIKSDCPSYSTSWFWIGQIIETLIEDDELFCGDLMYDGSYEQYRFLIRKYEEVLDPEYWPWANTGPLAVCRSALLTTLED